MGEIEIKQNMNHNENSEKMNQITMLGTGNATVSQIYNTCFLLKTSSTLMLVDAGGGNGILSQLKKVIKTIIDMILAKKQLAKVVERVVSVLFWVHELRWS